MLKRILLFILLIPIVSGAVSQNNFYSVGSDFLVIQNPESTSKQAPEIYALYDNTNIYLDINNDGAYDYKYEVDFGGPYTFSPPWAIADGTRIHADKPIYYRQSFYLDTYTNSRGTGFQNKKISAIVPIPNFEDEYLVRAGNWYILSDSENEVYVDEGIDGSVDNILSINKSTVPVTLGSFARMYSDKPFFAYSKEGLAGVLSKDFFSNEDKILIIAKEDSTTVSIDYNADGIPDVTSTIDKGTSYFDVVKGARITGDKEFSAYGYVNGSGKMAAHPQTYFPLPPSASLSNEFALSVKNDFILVGSNKGHYLLGLFNENSGDGLSFDVKLYGEGNYVAEEFYGLKTGETESLGNGFYVGVGGTPLSDVYSYYYNKGAYVGYFVGHTSAYKKIYLSARPKSKYITPNSSATLNIRVFNPFKGTIADDVSVKFRYNGLSMPAANVNFRKATLSGDDVIETSTQAVSQGSDADGNYFIFTYNDELEEETYLDIDFVLLMPSATGTITFQPTELSFKAETWIV